MSVRHRGTVLAVAVVMAAALWLPAAASADYEQVGNFAQSGNGEQLRSSTGAAVNVSGAGGVEAGSLYTSAGNRVSRYNAKGEIKEVWGWDTVVSGPDQSNETQALTVKATSGTYTLAANTAQGVGTLTAGSNVITGVTTELGTFRVGDAVTGLGIPSGTTILAVGAGTLELSAAATESSTRLVEDTETTAPIQYNATAAEVKAALVALEGFEAGDLSLTGGPGGAEGSAPYKVTFEGAFAGRDVGQMSATDVSLASGIPSSSATVETVSPGAAGYERCRPANGDVCALQEGNPPFAEEGVGRFFGPDGIAVDQSNGYVYVRNEIIYGNPERQHNLIEVFSADGSQVIARFGDAGALGESIEAGPEKLHQRSTYRPPIAVDDSGKVYLGDYQESEAKARVMCFRPESSGDYEHYVYCGRPQDIELGGIPAEQLAVDNAGHIYVASHPFIEELSPTEPTATPLCTFNTQGQLYSMTTNQQTGEVFYYLGTPASKAGVYRLKPCDPEAGEFEAAQAAAKASPATVKMNALAFNPVLAWGPNRPHGVLYGADAEKHGTQNGIGDIFAPAEVHPPTVLSESVSGTRTASAILHAEIDPHGFGTHYAFQYLTAAEYEANEPSERFAGAAEAPLGGGEIGGNAVGQAAASVAGLQPDTAYRFRVVASSECDEETGEPCVAEGEALAFATYPLTPPGLPDHRAWELVSPAQKHGGEVVPAAPGISSCETQCKPIPASAGITFPMQSSPSGEAVAYEGQPFSPEGAVNYDSYVSRRSATGWQTTSLIPALPLDTNQVAFDATLEHGLLSPESSKLEIQSTFEPGSTTPLVTETNHRSGGELQLAYGGHSADFSRQFFAANDSLTEETPFAPEPPDPGVAKKNLYEWHDGQLAVVNVLPGNSTVSPGATFASPNPDTHVVSDDGSRVFWTDEAGSLYVREDGETTQEVNDPGDFLSASPDGSEVLLTDGCLYSLQSEACTDLTEGKGGFQGLVGQSKDLSHLYFVDTAALGGEEENEAGEVAEAGKENLYSWSEGAPRFVAQLTPPTGGGLGGDTSDWAANPSSRTAEASPGGRYLAFASKARLTGYGNVGLCERVTIKGIETALVEAPCSEAFLYDSETGRLLCASCNPTGEAPLGNSYLRRIEGFSAGMPQPRYLTDEGRLYFDSQDSLTARDTNEGVEDVYEYEPQGTGKEGTCQRQAGCVFLISAGTESVDSNLLAVDESGKNVFFDSRDKLTLKDKDELLDLYDAREGGGIAAETEVARSECQGESCQAPIAPPNHPSPASSALAGDGNVKEETKAKKHKHAKRHKRHRARAAKHNRGGAK